MLGYWKNPDATKRSYKMAGFVPAIWDVLIKGLIRVTGRVKTKIVLKNGKKVF